MSPALFPLLDCDDLNMSIIARIPLHHYPTLSCTSRTLETMVYSKELFKERSNLGISEALICVCISSKVTGKYDWYCLGKKPEKKTSSSSAGFWLMKMKMANSYPAHSEPSMAGAGSTICLIAQRLYSELKLLNCETHVWSATPTMRTHPRNMDTSFLCAIKDCIYVLGGLDEEEGETSQHLKLRPESYRTTKGNDNGWTTLPYPGLDRNRKVVLVGSTDGKNLAFWSLSGDKSLKHIMDSQTVQWTTEPSGFLPSVFGNYSHTLFVGTIIIRTMGRMLCWFDELTANWNEVQGVRFRKVPAHVVAAGGSRLVAFYRPKYGGEDGTLIATEISLEKKGKHVLATQLWIDKVFSNDDVTVVLGSTSVNL